MVGLLLLCSCVVNYFHSDWARAGLLSLCWCNCIFLEEVRAIAKKVVLVGNVFGIFVSAICRYVWAQYKNKNNIFQEHTLSPRFIVSRFGPICSRNMSWFHYGFAMILMLCVMSRSSYVDVCFIGSFFRSVYFSRGPRIFIYYSYVTGNKWIPYKKIMK